MQPIFQYYKCPGLFWFRIFGYGLLIKDVKRHDLIPSEYLFNRGIRVGKYLIRKLKP